MAWQTVMAEGRTMQQGDCPTCGHRVVVKGDTREPIGCFQVVDDHELCERETAKLRAALERIALVDPVDDNGLACWNRWPKRPDRWCPTCIGGAEVMAEGNTVRRRVRDTVGRAIFTSGTALHKFGLWLCGVAGWWDAGTDG